MTFHNLNLHPLLLKGLLDAGYETPTPIQSQAIPNILKGLDIRGSAQTGTGKTAAFLLPAIEYALKNPSKSRKGPCVLILVPTRELGMQIAVQAEKYSKHLPQIKTVCIGGGIPLHMQMRKLSKPYDILIATPGRLLDFLGRKKIDLSQTGLLVLDEADRMLDMGFIEPVEEIVEKTSKKRQTLLFSATLKGNVFKLSQKLLTDPMEIVIEPEVKQNKNIKQSIYFTDDLFHKTQLLEHLLSKEDVEHTIVFTSTKRHADQLVSELKSKGHKTAALHGDMSQRQRNRTVKELKAKRIDILVATDVAARGIDIQSITHVINFDLPRSVEDYVHRIGRTGRAGASGSAFSFAARKESSLIKKIENYTGQEIPVDVIQGFEPKSPKKEFQNRRDKPSFPKKGKRPFKSFRKRSNFNR